MGTSTGCVDANFDDTNYSSPMPVIGLYIAGATLVCLLFMILDIIAASRNRKTWLPVRFFSLNLVMLSLLFVVAKLSRDLTTTMPSDEDQLSKLTSTILVYISMGFFFPSLGTNNESECLANIAALSILVGKEERESWTWKNGLNDMGRWKKKIDASNHLIKLLSRTSITSILLVRIATISISSSLTASLPSSLNEVFKVLQFVDRKLISSSFENKNKFILAEALWKRENFNYLRPKIIKMLGNNVEFEKQSQLNQSIAIIKGLPKVSLYDYLLLRAYESVQELYGCIEQLFVDMLNEFLIHLPNAIFREIIESNAEDSEEAVKFALKVLCKVESLEPLVRWSFPVGTTITHLTFNELPNA
ncbi:hypothetical protein Sjap_015352 [Stephania japonica]|uniref:Uncharacterized protein n=1 Tax=Stephania japonica TaxID=461633 RepID=A0AAP0IJF1_9MAGN